MNTLANKTKEEINERINTLLFELGKHAHHKEIIVAESLAFNQEILALRQELTKREKTKVNPPLKTVEPEVMEAESVSPQL